MLLTVVCLFMLICSNSYSGVLMWSLVGITQSIELVMVLDPVGMSFVLIVGGVSSMVLWYSLGYMESDQMNGGFTILLFSFVLSILFLVLSGNLQTIMLGWDGLGITSACLIMFYQNWKSFSSSIVTFLSNRLGDVFILMAIVLSWMSSSSGWSIGISTSLVAYAVIVASMTNSAQVPFSTWLPLAIAAPTPVSSLVHSSTLVTAGIYVLIRFGEVLGVGGMAVLALVSACTIMMAGVSSLAEMDFKKIIALSTLSHISLILFTISLGAVWSALSHMLVHSSFKSLLFMSAGNLIHDSGNSQDVRRVHQTVETPSSSLPTVVSLLSMTGAPFISGFYSKEILIESFSSGEFWKLLIFVTGLLFTFAYSVRIGSYLLDISMPSSYNIWVVNSVLIGLGCVVSSFLSGLVVEIMVEYYESVSISIVAGNVKSVYLLSALVVGVILGMKHSYLATVNDLSTKVGASMVWVGSTSKLFNSWNVLNVIYTYNVDMNGFAEYLMGWTVHLVTSGAEITSSLTINTSYQFKLLFVHFILWAVFFV